MASRMRWLIRVTGFFLVLGSLYPFWRALTALDRHDWVSAILATIVGWLTAQAGVDFLRPESAE
jgi:hypothetical protein